MRGYSEVDDGNWVFLASGRGESGPFEPVTLSGFQYTWYKGTSRISESFPEDPQELTVTISHGDGTSTQLSDITAILKGGFVGKNEYNTYEANAVIEFRKSDGQPAVLSLKRGESVVVTATGVDDWPESGKSGEGKTEVKVRNWTAPAPLQKDPLFDRKDECIVPQKGEVQHLGTTTWIAESFYAPSDTEAATGQGPRDIRRNYTVLQYRDEATQTFQPVNGGNVTPWVYNGLAYNAEDGFLYAISQDRPKNAGDRSGVNGTNDENYKPGRLLKISPVDGSVQNLGEITVPNGGFEPNELQSGFTNGTFDVSGNYIFSNNSAYGSGYVYTISFQDGKPILQATKSEFANKQQSANDWAHFGFQSDGDKWKYLWSINSKDGKRYIYRTDSQTGEVRQWDVTNLATPAGNRLEDGVYGNAWTYNNGNLGFSVNNKGIAYQIAIDGFDTDNPKFALVSAERVPTSYNNDATSNARLVAKPEFEKAAVDLSVRKELELDPATGKAFWTITVKNESTDCTSSGFTLRDVMSSDTLKVNDVAPMSAGWLDRSHGDNGFNWTHGPLEAGGEAKLRIDSDLVEGQKCAVNKVSVIGNERDSDDTNNTDLAGDCVSKLTIKKYIKQAEEGDNLKATPEEIVKTYKDAQDAEAAVIVDKTKPLRIAYVVTNEGGTPVSNISISDVASGHNADAFNDKINESIQTEISKRYPDGFNLDPEAKGAVVVTADPLNADAAFHRDSAVARGEYDPAAFDGYPKFNGGDADGGSYDPFENLPNPSGTRTVVSNEDEANAETPLQILIEKRINGRKKAVVKSGEDMEIWYRVTNPNAIALHNISLVDEITEGSVDQQDLADKLKEVVGNEGKFDLEPGESKEFSVKVTATNDVHENVVRPTLPPTTVDGPLVPATTRVTTTEHVVPGTTVSPAEQPPVTAEDTTYPATTIPGVTIPETTVVQTIPVTTVSSPRPQTVEITSTPSATATATPVRLDIVKDIIGKDGATYAGDAPATTTPEGVTGDTTAPAPVEPGKDMVIVYTVTNNGQIDLTNVSIADQVLSVEGDQDGNRKSALQDEINAALKTAGVIPTLKAGESKPVTVTVTAPEGAHVNEAKATAPGVPQPETVIPGTTITPVPGSPVTIPPTTVPATVVTPNTPSNQARSTPTTSEVPAPVDPQFAVEKLSNQPGISLERNEDGKYAYSASYTVRVRNTGTVAGTHAKVEDVPVRGVGFDIDSVTVDGAEVAPSSGTYLISDGAELGVGEYKDYQVVVAGTLSDESANALPAAVGQCDAVTPQNPGAGSGLVNTVQMAGDSDGPDNNIVCEPVELRRLNVEKRIDGRESAPVTPGEPMEIWYRVRNTGNVALSGVTLADRITEDNDELQAAIDAEIEKIGAFDLAPGEFNDVKFAVTAPEGAHTNEVEAQVPETTVPGTTRPETTVPGTTNETTTVPPSTIPGTTVPGRSVPPTTVTATAHANSPKLEIKKYINGYDEGTQVAPGEDMEILYRVANTGAVRIDGISLDDEVTEAADEKISQALQRDIDAALKNVAPFALEPGDVREVRISVPAPAGGHVNVAKPIVSPVTVPGTTIPGTTNPNTTVPGTTVPSTVVTVTTPSDDARSDSPALDIKKYINNLDEGDIVEPGQDMVITYRVFNNGNVDAKGVTIADEVTEGSDAVKDALGKQIADELGKVDPIDIPAGEFRDVEITVTAPEGGHVNVARPVVPPVTVPATTIPGTTNPNTTIPETTVPERVVTPTTTPSDDARSDSLKLEILKDIYSLSDNTWHAADTAEDAAVVDANGQMRVRYTVTNTGSVALSGINIVDNVTRLDEGDTQELTDALNAALEAEGLGFDLAPGEKKVVEITVDAPKGYHVNEAIATVPAVPTTQTQVTSVPGTTDATTTVPGSLTTTVVTTEKTPNVPTNTAQATPTTSVPPVKTVVTTVPQAEQPQFAVEKLAGRAGSVALTRNDNGGYEYSNEYVIRVRNAGTVAGEHAAIWDVPLRGAGFTVSEVTVDDNAVEAASGRYKIADANQLAPGESKEYRVAVTGTLAEAAADNLPEAVGQCNAEGANPGADSGLVNVVNMDGDSDGPANNVVCTPVELRRLNIEKRIDGREDAVVTPGEPMEIWYRVRNTGNVELANIALADQIREDNQALQEEINAQLAEKAKPFDLAPGAFRDIKIEVTAPEGEHNDDARAEVPPVTVPPSTRPATTIPGTTGPSTTVPPVTIPETTLPGTTVPGTSVSTTARANSPQLSVKKFINGRDEHALVNAGEDMEITYRVTNNGTVRVDGVRLTDQVKEDNAELQQAIDAQLGKVDPFALAPGESREVTVTVKAPAGRHDDTVNVTVPPVTIPATTIPGTTNPNTTIPGTTVPATVVTVTAPPDDASSDSPQLEILKEIKRADDGDDAWRDAETEADALPVAPGEAMQLRYTVRNTGSVELSGIDVVDEVTRLDEGDAGEFTAEINAALEAEGRNFALAPGEEKVIVVTVTAPAGYHVNEAIATAPPVTATETVVSSIPGTTNETTTVPGTVTTETTVVERTPNTPTNKAQSTPTTGVAPCDCEIKTTTITPAPVTTTEAGKVTTITPDPVTSEVTVTTTEPGKVATVTPDPVTSEVTVTTTPAPVTTTEAGKVTTVTPDPVTSEVTVTTTPAPVVTTVEGPAVTETLPQITVTEVTTTTSEPLVDEGNDILGRCISNAVRSPILYMVPLLLASQVLGEAAAPYVKAVNDQFNKISAEIQDEIRRKTPNFGYGRRGEENEQVAELRAKAEAANRMLQELAMRPDVQQYGQWAAIAAGVVVAGSVLYDWCSNEEGEAFTAVGPNGSSSKSDVEVGGSSLRERDESVETIVAPVTDTEGSAEGSSE